MANAGCINAISYDGCLIRTLENLNSSNIGVGVQFCAPDPLDDKRFDYIKYTDKCGCTCCLTNENEILIYATQGTLKNLTLTNDDANEVVNVKRTDLFGSNRKKTVVRYKTGGYPTSITDGTLAVEELVQNQYSSSGYNVSGLSDGTTYYFSVFAIAQDDTVIVVQTDSITTSFGYIVNANTLFYIKNDGEISDHSTYNHTMQWYGTSAFATLSNGRKVLNLSGNNLTYSNQFTEANNKTKFTLHQRIKLKNGNPNEIVYGGRTGRNKSGTDTTDRRGARFQSDSAGSRSYILVGPSSSSRINTETGYSLYTSIGTSEFALLSTTVNGGTYKLYKNGTLVGTCSSSTIRGGSSTGPRFYLGGCVYPDGTLRLAGLLAYIGEAVLEDKTETDAEVLDFYNKTKNHYV